MHDKIKILAEKILNPEISYSPDMTYTQLRIIQQNVDCAKEILKELDKE